MEFTSVLALVMEDEDEKDWDNLDKRNVFPAAFTYSYKHVFDVI